MSTITAVPQMLRIAYTRQSIFAGNKMHADCLIFSYESNYGLFAYKPGIFVKVYVSKQSIHLVSF